MPRVDEGDPAPHFELPDGEGKMRSLDEFRGAPLVLYFYPGDFTPGCTKEACAFQERLSDFNEFGAQVVGVSPDSPKSHRAFANKHGLAFTLLADEDKAVAERYGVRTLIRTGRVTFVIDRDGVVRSRIQSLFAGPHIRRSLEQLQGEVVA